jgi:quercetin dioxygenase-like cupin family protein
LKNAEFEKSKIFSIVDTIKYITKSVEVETILRKITGNITAVSFDSGEALIEKISPFDIFIQIIEGRAEVLITEQSFMLETGQSIIIPAHARHTIKANERFKMLSTTIKSGYEDLM